MGLLLGQVAAIIGRATGKAKAGDCESATETRQTFGVIDACPPPA
jgi:hypothetical protein